jgi:membrane protease YdiL (CAAX protease family)
MAKAQRTRNASGHRGLLARPLDSLVFLLPLLLFYEIVSLTRASRVIAFDVLKQFFDLFGYVGVWAPGLAVVIILVATHVASGEKWRVHWRQVGLMYVEVVLLAMPLLLLNWTVPLQASRLAYVSTANVIASEAERPSVAISNAPQEIATPAGGGLAMTSWAGLAMTGTLNTVHLAAAPANDLVGQLAVGIGAGIYEELVFRLVLISILVMIGLDFLKMRRVTVTVAAVAISALIFSAHHHYPIGNEPFVITRFLFRTMAGAYLAVVFWYRGYGPAAGCHAAYNVALTVIDPTIS